MARVVGLKGREKPPARVLRVIARMNMGGPAHHVSLLSGLLDRDRYETLLVHGRVGRGEASLAELAERYETKLRLVPTLRPELRPVDDVKALRDLVGLIRRVRPAIVHTHTSKAGVLGRLAVVLAGDPRPRLVHTYHGHVLTGYFGPVRNTLYRAIERRLGRITDCLVGVSAATVDDLVQLGVAPRQKFRVIQIGLDLEPFLNLAGGAGAELRRELAPEPGDVLLTFVGRLVPIKNVDLLLRAVARARDRGAPVRVALVGDGELRGSLEKLSRELGIGDAVRFLGYRSDVATVAAAGDIALLTSQNEGTPVSLIEAAAAGRPAIATAVGGVPEVVTAESGMLVPAGDERALADAICRLAGDPALRGRMGAHARRHVAERFSAGRLVNDVAALYDELLTERRPASEEARLVASR